MRSSGQLYALALIASLILLPSSAHAQVCKYNVCTSSSLEGPNLRVRAWSNTYHTHVNVRSDSFAVADGRTSQAQIPIRGGSVLLAVKGKSVVRWQVQGCDKRPLGSVCSRWLNVRKTLR